MLLPKSWIEHVKCLKDHKNPGIELLNITYIFIHYNISVCSFEECYFEKAIEHQCQKLCWGFARITTLIKISSDDSQNEKFFEIIAAS